MRVSRLLHLSALIGVAASAHAFTLDLFSHGHYLTAPGIASATDTVLFQDSSIPTPSLTSLNYSFSTGGPYVGTGMYTNGVDSLLFSISFSSGLTPSPTTLVDGTWSYTGGTGAFAGLSGSGVISSIFKTSGTSTLTTFSGDLEPLPEPASLAAIGIGAMGLLRLKKRR